MLDRRQFLCGALAGTGLLLARAHAAPAPDRPRLVLIILRGGLDGLHAVPPVGDPDYARLRGAVAVPARGEGAALALAGQSDFALHPLLPELAGRYAAGELLIAHAVASPYRERSHFDAQDVLESGIARPHGRDDGWLNRALAGLSGTGERGIAISASLPLVLRGETAVGNWSPSARPAPDEDFLARVAWLYAGDAALAATLRRAREVNGQAGGMQGMDATASGGRPRLVQAAARFLADPSGPSAVVLEVGGWDSHSAAFHPQGALSRSLRQLDASLAELRVGAGAAWSRTAVLVLTEFGRTARANGSGGTDHGTASCAFVLGGAVRGGRVLADWPGLREADLHEQRDLRPTTDLRALCKGLLMEHLRLPESLIETQVFPDSRGTRPVEGLV